MPIWLQRKVIPRANPAAPVCGSQADPAAGAGVAVKASLLDGNAAMEAMTPTYIFQQASHTPGGAVGADGVWDQVSLTIN